MALFLSFSASLSADVVLNEILALNETILEDPDEPGAFDDWVELYNPDPVAADIGGMYLSDDPLQPTRWKIPEGTTIAAGAFAVIWLDGDTEQGALHANFRLESNGERLALHARDGTTLVDQVQFRAQEPDISYGRRSDGVGRWCFMTEPTPGAPNGRCRSGEPLFSRRGGTFTGKLELELTAAAENARIFYTVNRREPDEEDGLEYKGPIEIETSTWVRARVYEDDLEPGPVRSETYIALDPELADFDSNLPLVVVDTFGRNFDAEGNRRPRPWRAVMTAFIETDPESGRARLNDQAQFAGYGAMHVRGSSTVQYPKKSYAFETRDEFEEDRPVSLLGMPRESDWILHAPYSDKTLMRNHVMHSWSRSIGRYAVRTRFVEVFMRKRAGRVTGEDYQGVHVLMERVKRDNSRVDVAPLDPGDREEPEITGGYVLKRDWLEDGKFFTTKTYRDGITYVDPQPQEITTPQRNWIKSYIDDFEAALAGPRFRDPDEGYVRYIDTLSFIDHHLLVELSRNVDGFVLSTYMHKDRGGKLKMGPIWDFNGALGGANYFCTCQTDGWHHTFNESNCPECREGGAQFPADNPNGYRWYERLQEDPDYQQRYAERWFELRQDELSTEQLLDDIDSVVKLLTDDGAADNAVRRNFEKWRILNTYVWPNFRVRGSYLEHVDWLKTWIEGRGSWMDRELIVPPSISPEGGEIERGTEVTLLAVQGEVFYTLNGPDPRADDGSPAAEAQRFAAPIAIQVNTRVAARVRAGEEWSRLVTAAFVTDPIPLRVSEIMYNPPEFPDDIATSRTRYEFVEVLNVGLEAVELDGVRVLRFLRDAPSVRFDFSASEVTSLGPGERLVLVNDLESFRSRYGARARIAGEFSGNLSNARDRIALVGRLDEPIVDFTYDDDWYPQTDGDGHSLVLADTDAPASALSGPDPWRASAALGGSPGEAEPAAAEGLQLAGDINQDSELNISDVVRFLLHLFRGASALPCGSDASNRTLLDLNGDERVDVSDALYSLRFQFLGGPAPALGPSCTKISDCPDACKS